MYNHRFLRLPSTVCACLVYLHLSSSMATQARPTFPGTFKQASCFSLFPGSSSSITSKSLSFSHSQVFCQSPLWDKFCRFTATAKTAKLIVLVLPFNSSICKKMPIMSYCFPSCGYCRHFTTKLTVLYIQFIIRSTCPAS